MKRRTFEEAEAALQEEQAWLVAWAQGCGSWSQLIHLVCWCCCQHVGGAQGQGVAPLACASPLHLHGACAAQFEGWFLAAQQISSNAE